jgi:hypothetical protein
MDDIQANDHPMGISLLRKVSFLTYQLLQVNKVKTLDQSQREQVYAP